MIRAAISIWLVLVALSYRTHPAGAEEKQSPSQVIHRAKKTVGAIDAQVKCLQSQRRTLVEILALLREAQEQAQQTGRDHSVRRDAHETVKALRARVERTEREASSCKTLLPDPPPERIPTNDPTLEAIEQANPATREFERDAKLTPLVRVVVGEQVDGLGQIQGAAIRKAIRTIRGSLNACYRQCINRGHKRPQQLNVVFTVARDGRIVRPEVEDTGDSEPHLRRCVRRAARALRISEIPSGGRVVISYTLRFFGTPKGSFERRKGRRK